MADRNLNFDPTVTNVTPKLPDDGIISGISDFADTIAQQSASAKALNATAQTALAFRQLDGQFREQNAGDPTNPQAMQDLQAKRSEIMAQIGQQVPAIASRDYMSHAIELGQSSDRINELWATHQEGRNAFDNLQSARYAGIQLAAVNGKNFAASGGSSDADLANALDFAHANAAITQFATPVLGAPKTQEYLKSYNEDLAKSFVANVAESNPQLAAKLLESPTISSQFSAQDIGDMAQVIQKTQKQQQLIQTLQTTKNDGGLVDLVNDPNSSYFEKRAKIDEMDMAGDITPKAASAARRVIKSAEDVDSQTDTPVMADLVNKTYDLNANANTNADDYLNGVQNIHQQILEAQAQGKLTGQDAQKVTRQINDLTSKKLSDATNTAGMEFYDANQKFNALPPEYRGQATRALFYAGSGNNWTPQQYSNQATQIIQQINERRRQSALTATMGIPQDDNAFLATVPNASPEAVQATAQKYGISTQQVILQLRSDAIAKARAKQNGVKRVAPGGSSDDDREEEDKPEGIKLQGPPPADNDDEEQGMVQ